MSTRSSILVAVLALATLSGCAAEPAGSAFMPTATSADASYLAAVRDAAPTLTGIEDSRLTESGRGVCTALGEGRTADLLAERAVEYGLQQIEGEAIIETAMTVYCPEHLEEMSN